MAVILIRVFFLYLFTMLAVRLMGKRQLGEMEPAELVVTLLISDLATLCMQDPELPMINSIASIFLLVVAEVLISSLMMKFPRLRGAISGRYSVVIDRGRIDQKEMRRAQMTVDELLEAVRQNGLTSPDEVSFCILENDGKISVIPRESGKNELPLILISDGVAIPKNLRRGGVTREDLRRMAAQRGIAGISDVFLLYRRNGKYVFVQKEKKE